MLQKTIIEVFSKQRKHSYFFNINSVSKVFCLCVECLQVTFHSSNDQEQVDNFMHYIAYQAENSVKCTNTIHQVKDNKSRDSIKQNKITYQVQKIVINKLTQEIQQKLNNYRCIVKWFNVKFKIVLSASEDTLW